MSDIRKWMQILSEDSIEQGSAVKLSDDYGGGIGTFERLSEDNPDIAVINVKGTAQEIPLTSLQKVLDQDHEYGEDPCYNITPDLFEPGASVRVKNLYGGGTGDGYGVFVAYSTDGQTAIVNVDSEERSIPVDLVYPADEQCAKDNFASVGSDGSQSPFTSAGDNVQDKGISKMSDMERWMDAVSNPKQAPVQETECNDCDCGDYECTTCFPLSEDELSYESMCSEEPAAEEEDLVELDIDNSEHYPEDDLEDEPEPRVGDDEAVDIDLGDAMPYDNTFDEPDAGVELGASEDVSDLLSKIDYVQNMGMSMTDRHYDVDQLMKMKPDAIKRIYAKVIGEAMGESIEADLFAEDLGNSSDDGSDSLLVGDPDEGRTYTLVEPGDTVMFKGHQLVYQGFYPKDENYAVVELKGQRKIVPIVDFTKHAVPGEMVETASGSVSVGPGLGKIQDRAGVYEASSIDPAELKSLERMDVESAKAKAAEMIQGSKTSDKRKAQLVHNVSKSRNVVQVLQLMYNLMLSGDGLSTVGSKWQKKYNEAVQPHRGNDTEIFREFNDDGELDRMRQLAGLRDDGINSGALTRDDFKDMFWDYWDKSSPSSQHQYLTAVLGDDTNIEDFSDAAVEVLDHILNAQDPAVVDKQLHMLRRIGMPLMSVCPDTGEFYPA